MASAPWSSASARRPSSSWANPRLHLFLYELVTGGGMLDQSAVPPSLLAEGSAMLAALAADFAAIGDVKISALRDGRLEDLGLSGCAAHVVRHADQERGLFAQLAAEADWTVVIAPELDGMLLQRVRCVEAVGGRPLGPGSELVALASDKQRTAEHLAAAGVPAPQGRVLAADEPLPANFSYPAVLKPLDGAGSHEVRLVATADAAPARRSQPMRLERFCEGTPVSVAALCGPRGHVLLPPCRQRLSGDGRFRYLGGSLPLAPPLAARATRLAEQALAALDHPLGYLGLDLVLGPEPHRPEDVVIEINPRLTTSYVGLRAACTGNLAAAMLALAQGEPAVVAFRPEPVQFEPAPKRAASPFSSGDLPAFP